MDTYRVQVTFVEPLLGTVPKDKDIYAGYIASIAALTDEALAEELETVPVVEEKGWTGFHTLENGQPALYDYVVKGFFKDACGMLRRTRGSESAKLKAYKKIIDGLVFVKPRRIPLILPDGAALQMVERPLRAQTAQGERVALARSDAAPAGTVMRFTVTVLGEVTEKTLREWFDYGVLRGFGQWRNGGYGRFQYEIEQG